MKGGDHLVSNCLANYDKLGTSINKLDLQNKSLNALER